MIDSTKSPMPTWRRYAMVAALAILIAVAAYVVWVKELHHSSSPASSPAPVATVPARPAKAKSAPHTTSVPGGIPISSRNPFGS